MNYYQENKHSTPMLTQSQKHSTPMLTQSQLNLRLSVLENLFYRVRSYFGHSDGGWSRVSNGRLSMKNFTLRYSGRQFIQQGLSDGLLDVDSVFYCTRKSQFEAFDIKFDKDDPKVALPQGMLVPVNSFNTLFHSSTFWGSMLPVSISTTMPSDVLSGYWAHRLLWEIGGFVAVYPSTIFRYDRVESYPFLEEKDLHVNVSWLIKFLAFWRTTKPTLFEKILHLSYSMTEVGFWTEKDVRFTVAWLQDLMAAGF